MGAAIGSGCGGATEERPLGDGGGEPGDQASTVPFSEAGFSTAPSECNGGLYSSSCFNPSSCHGTREQPQSPPDCAYPQQFECGLPGAPTGCACVATAPLVATDCTDPAQFTCVDWSQPCGCTCNTSAPLTPSACCPSSAPDASPASTDASASDASLLAMLDAAPDGASPEAAPPSTTLCATPWECHSYAPPVGCACRMIPPPIL
jgi:hypothetical protein